MRNANKDNITHGKHQCQLICLIGYIKITCREKIKIQKREGYLPKKIIEELSNHGSHILVGSAMGGEKSSLSRLIMPV